MTLEKILTVQSITEFASSKLKLQIKEQTKDLPDGIEFWKETGLANRLRNLGKYQGQDQEDLEDMLDFLADDVQVD